MPSLNRNVNLEEIKTSPVLETDFIKYASRSQLFLLIGSFGLSILLMLYNSFIIDDNSAISTFIAMVPIIIGILFGCQYTPEIPLYKYIYLYAFPRKKTLYKMSTEDMQNSRGYIKDYMTNKVRSDKLLKEELKQKKKKKTAILVGTILIIFSLLFAFFTYKLNNRPSKHRDIINTETQNNENQ